MNRRFIRQTLLLALLYYAVAMALDGIIFLLSHIPPKAANLDGFILRLGDAARILAWPRGLLRRLWPGESTPTGLNFALTVINCLLWGAALTGLKQLWTNVRK